MKEKVLSYKTYNSIGHLSGSRLGTSDSKIDAKTEGILTKEFPRHQKCYLYVQEKMDGSNVCVVRLNGQLRVLGRSGYDCMDSNQEQHTMFYRYVMANSDKFEKLLPNEHDRVVGEWLALAHGTIYKDLVTPFMAFDLYHNKVQLPVKRIAELVGHVGLHSVPCVYQGEKPIEINDALNLVDANAEGVVYRLEKVKKDGDNIPWIIAKVVRQEKEDGKYLKDPELPVWNWTE